MRNIDRIIKYVDEEWDEECVYTPRDIADLFNCDARVARYYLMAMVEDGKLVRLKYCGRIYFIKPHQAEWFEEFKSIGLVIW